MRKYENGDKVYARYGLKVDKKYGNNSFVSDMKRYIGEKMTITRYVEDAGYEVKENHWYWTKDMLTNKEPAKRDFPDKYFPEEVALIEEGENILLVDNMNWYQERSVLCVFPKDTEVLGDYPPEYINDFIEELPKIINLINKAREIYEEGERNDEAIQDIALDIGFRVMNYFGAGITGGRFDD